MFAKKYKGVPSDVARKLAERDYQKMVQGRKYQGIPTDVAQKLQQREQQQLAKSATSKTALDYAMGRLGDPYSQAKAGTGSYVDCSKLTQLSYQAAGINLPRTAAEQAKWCDQNGKTISTGYDESQLQPGDLVYFSLTSNGRYKDISHAAMYAGDGKFVEASSGKGQVVHRKAWGTSHVKVVCRPA